MVSKRTDRLDNSNMFLTRRKALLGLIGVSAFGINSTAFTTGNSNRGVVYEVGGDSSSTSVLTLINTDFVVKKRSNQEAITLTNNSSGSGEISISLTTPQVVFTDSQTSQLVFQIASGETRTIFLDVANSQDNTVEYSVDFTTNQFTLNLNRSDIQIVNNPNQADPTPNQGEISIIIAQKGNSNNYSLEWSVGGDTSQYDSITVRINGTQVDTLTSFNGSINNIQNTYNIQQGDTITFELLDPNGTVINLDSQTL